MNELLNDYAIWSHSDMDKISAQLNEWTKFYDEGHPQVSDEEWDKWYFELLKWEQATHYYPPNSPTQNISYQVINELKKVEHNHKMLSLDKTKNIHDVIGFINNQDVLIMTKCDGLTCSLRYLDGKLVSAETRGNGLIGEDITHNALVVSSIPNRIDYKDELVVDGEIVCLQHDFEQFANDYKNPRNFAAGSIRLLDSEICSKRKLTFFVWDVIKGFEDYNYLNSRLDGCAGLGFLICPWILEGKFDEFLLKDIIEMSDDIPYDGVVIKYNNIAYGKSLGETAHHFKNAIAYKLYDELYQTNLIDIEWTMGRTGVLTPVAIFEPVEIDKTVTRANLHNLSVMEEVLGKPAFKGEELYIYLANQIIPQVHHANVAKNLYKTLVPIDIPATCPICGEKTIRRKNFDTEELYCSNPNCEGKFINKLEHFCGKSGLDIRGLSKATLGKLIDEFWINKLEDIFNLEQYRSLWIKMPGFGPTSVNNILTAIENSKQCSLDKFLCALSIPQIGQTASKQLAQFFKSYDAFRKAVDENFNFTKLPDFGDITNKKIHEFDFTEADKLYNILNILPIEEKANNKEFDGLKFAVTGSVSPFTNRTALKEFVEAHGGKIVSSISKNVNYLITNDSTSNSSKNQAAQKLGIPIVSGQNIITLSIDKS